MKLKVLFFVVAIFYISGIQPAWSRERSPTLLDEVVQNGRWMEMDDLVSQGIKSGLKGSEKFFTLLFVSAWQGNEKLFSKSMKKLSAVDPTNRLGETPLMIAVSSDFLYGAKMLLQAGADPSSRNHLYQNALFYARSGRMVQLLIEHGIELEVYDKSGRTAFFYIAGNADVEALQLLVDSGMEYDRSDLNGFTPVYYSVLQGKQDNLVFLLQAGADIHTKSLKGDTLLMAAAHQNRSNLIPVLLEQDVPIEAVNRDGKTAFLIAAERGSFASARALIENNADLTARDNKGENAFDFAHRKRDKLMIGLFRMAGVKDSEDAGFVYMDEEKIRTLLEYSRDARLDQLPLLKEKLWNVNVSLPYDLEGIPAGFTPLMTAVWHGHTSTVSFLLHMAALVNMKNPFTGRTAASYAEEKGFRSLIEMIREAGGK